MASKDATAQLRCASAIYVQHGAIVQDLGVYDDPDSFYQLHSQEMNQLKKIIYGCIARHWINRNVRRIRNKWFP